MYLRTLELQGFKSFPDKTKLRFDKGLTVVVGPNGSGKSNLSDAVRWVLGEQSTKTLRGNKMEDVIFSGTKNRKSMGFAAVTLEIDNADHALGDEYGDVVAVTRKLYRSGESNYLLNGKNVRLRDVMELFMDTGLGRDGYAIIGQGRIAEIVSAKSTDRRDIFEEAAGVAKFRYKKEDAQRRLDAAEENLTRLRDILSELAGRLEPLRAQSEKARQYVVLAGEQKGLEVSLWVLRLNALRGRLRALSDDALKTEALLENTAAQMEKTEKEIADRYVEMQKSTLGVERARGEIASAEKETADLRAKAAVAENEIEHAKANIHTLQENLTTARAEKERLLAEKERFSEQLNALTAQKNALEIKQKELARKETKLHAEISLSGTLSKKADDALQGLLLARAALEADAQNVTEQQEELRARNAGQGAALSALKEELDKANAACKSAAGASEEARAALKNLQAQLTPLRMQEKEAADAVSKQKDARDKISLALQNSYGRQRLLQDLERNFEGFSGAVKQILRSNHGHPPGVFGTVAQLIDVPQKFSLAIETALGAAAQHLVVENEDAAKRWIAYLKKNHSGRATFLPLTTVRGRTLAEQGLAENPGFLGIAENLVQAEEKFRGVLSFLLGRVVVAENLDSATDLAKKYGFRFRVVTLDGQVLNPGGSFTGGSAQHSGVVSRRAELEELGKRIDVQKSALKDAEEMLQKAQGDAKDLADKLEKLHTQILEAQRLGLLRESEMQNCVYQKQQAEMRLREAREQGAHALEREEALKQKFEQSQKALLDLAQKIEAAQKEREEKAARLALLEGEEHTRAEETRQGELAKLSAQKDLDALQGEAERAVKALHDTDEKMDGYARDIEEQKRHIQNIQTGQKNHGAALQKCRDIIERAKREIQTWQTRHDEQTQATRQLQSGMAELGGAKARFSGELERIEERRGNAQNDYDALVRQLFEQYDLSLSEAEKAAKPIEDVPAAEKALRSLRAKIRALGSVNVAAIEEYKEVSSRHAFLSKQMQDAAGAKKELEELIVSLTAQMQTVFSKSFAQINQNFKEIFKELFGGGEGELKLLDPEHVLESGIEIKVAPPGKVIKNLISLSAGEQAFVAIAIYFAILRLKPSPFCILDEIDAALDEGNVRTYAQYLHRFTDKTQFILVTHRRVAMEEGNVLYGVTMQEDGISRLLRMEQVEEVEGLEG